MKYIDTVVIGGGILGCFAARSLLRFQMSVLLIEQKEDVCTGITRANSAIVYSGCDNKPGSLKAEMTVRANAGFENLCRDLDVPFSRCGSLAVAFGPKGEKVLEQKYENGKKSNVPDLALLSGEEARKLEPGLSEQVIRALYVPGTGTVNPWQLGIAAYENALENGCEVWLGTKVTGIQKNGQEYQLKCDSDSGVKNIMCRAVINCAGLFSDKVQEILFAPSVRLFPDGAGFLVLDREVCGPRHILFQETEEDGKGVTIIPSVEGNVLVASPKRNQKGEPFAVDDTVIGLMKQMAYEVFPQTDFGQVIRSFGAVRPNPHYADGRSIGSFTITHPAEGFYSLIGVKTPGLTCANELGIYLAEKISEYLGTAVNPSFHPVRKKIPRMHGMDFEKRSAYVAEHPEYGEIVCLCEDVSKGEILEAIKRGAVTVDGVKRRTGTGMGRCQGSRCSQKIERLIKECRTGMK